MVSVPADAVNAANEGKLVHVSGAVKTGDPISDDELGVQAQAVKLVRTVEMYQWKEDEKSEERKKLGGGTETTKTYTYEKNGPTRPSIRRNSRSRKGTRTRARSPTRARPSWRTR